MVQLNVTCECGQRISVSEGSAGAQIPCDCGRTIDVPPLHILRRLNRVPEGDVRPEIAIWTLLESGELPPKGCLGCGADAETIRFNAECESMRVVDQLAASSWILSVLFVGLGLIFGWFILLTRVLMSDGKYRHYGKDVYIPIPAQICRGCRSALLQPPPSGLIDKLGIAMLIIGIGSLVLQSFALGIGLLVFGAIVRLLSKLMAKAYQKRLKQLLCQVPFYARVFERYPNAPISQSGML